MTTARETSNDTTQSNTVNYDDMPIMQAAKAGDLDKVKKLFQDDFTKIDKTALFIYALDANPSSKTTDTSENKVNTPTDIIRYLHQVKGIDFLNRYVPTFIYSGTKTYLPLTHYAAYMNHQEALQYFIANGADINEATKDVNAYTLFDIAAMRNNLELCKTLLKSGATTQPQNDENITSQHHAATCNATTVLKWLIQEAGEVDVDKKGRNPLHRAVTWRCVETVRYLVTEPSLKDLRAKNLLNYDAESLAYLNKNTAEDSAERERYHQIYEIIAAEIKKRKLPHETIEDGDFSSPIMQAAESGRLDEVKRMYQDDFPQKTKEMLFVAALRSEPRSKTADVDDEKAVNPVDIIKFLHEEKRIELAGIITTDKFLPKVKLNLIHKASLYGHIDAVKYFIHNGVPPQQATQDDYKFTPFVCAAAKNKLALCQYLYTLAPDTLNYVTSKGKTVQHITADANALEVLQWLIKNAKKIDLDHLWQTPLHAAIDSPGTDIRTIEYLANEPKINLHAITKDGFDALALARRAKKVSHKICDDATPGSSDYDRAKAQLDISIKIIVVTQKALKDREQKDNQKADDAMHEFAAQATKKTKLSKKQKQRLAKAAQKISLEMKDGDEQEQNQSSVTTIPTTSSNSVAAPTDQAPDSKPKQTSATKSVQMKTLRVTSKDTAQKDTVNYEDMPIMQAALSGRLDEVKRLYQDNFPPKTKEMLFVAALSAEPRPSTTGISDEKVVNPVDIITFLHQDKKISFLNTTIHLVVQNDTETPMALIHYAAYRGHSEAVHYFIGKGVDINITTTDSFAFTPLCLAAMSDNNLELCKTLFDSNATLNSKCAKGLTPQHHAAISNATTVLAWLIQTRKKIDVDNNGRTPLHLAVLNRCRKTVSYLATLPLLDLRAKNSPHHDDAESLAYWKRNQANNKQQYDEYNEIYEIIAAAVKIKHPHHEAIKGGDFASPIMQAAESGRLDEVKRMYQDDLPQITKETLFAAALHAELRPATTDTADEKIVNPVDIIKYLHKRTKIKLAGIVTTSIYLRNVKLNLIHIASLYGHIDAVRYFINQGISPLQAVPEGDQYTPFACAAMKNRLDICQYLHDHTPTTLHYTNSKGETLLHLAAKHNAFHVLKWLIEQTEITNLSHQGRNPLHTAIDTLTIDVKIIEYLATASKIDLRAKTKDGLDALTMARQSISYYQKICDQATPGSSDFNTAKARLDKFTAIKSIIQKALKDREQENNQKADDAMHGLTAETTTQTKFKKPKLSKKQKLKLANAAQNISPEMKDGDEQEQNQSSVATIPTTSSNSVAASTDKAPDSEPKQTSTTIKSAPASNALAQENVTIPSQIESPRKPNLTSATTKQDVTASSVTIQTNKTTLTPAAKTEPKSEHKQISATKLEPSVSSAPAQSDVKTHRAISKPMSRSEQKPASDTITSVPFNYSQAVQQRQRSSTATIMNTSNLNHPNKTSRKEELSNVSISNTQPTPLPKPAELTQTVIAPVSLPANTQSNDTSVSANDKMNQHTELKTTESILNRAIIHCLQSKSLPRINELTIDDLCHYSLIHILIAGEHNELAAWKNQIAGQLQHESRNPLHKNDPYGIASKAAIDALLAFDMWKNKSTKEPTKNEKDKESNVQAKISLGKCLMQYQDKGPDIINTYKEYYPKLLKNITEKIKIQAVAIAKQETTASSAPQHTDTISQTQTVATPVSLPATIIPDDKIDQPPEFKISDEMLEQALDICLQLMSAYRDYDFSPAYLCHLSLIQFLISIEQKEIFAWMNQIFSKLKTPLTPINDQTGISILAFRAAIKDILVMEKSFSASCSEAEKNIHAQINLGKCLKEYKKDSSSSIISSYQESYPKLLEKINEEFKSINDRAEATTPMAQSSVSAPLSLPEAGHDDVVDDTTDYEYDNTSQTTESIGTHYESQSTQTSQSSASTSFFLPQPMKTDSVSTQSFLPSFQQPIIIPAPTQQNGIYYSSQPQQNIMVMGYPNGQPMSQGYISYPAETVPYNQQATGSQSYASYPAGMAPYNQQAAVFFQPVIAQPGQFMQNNNGYFL